MADSTVVVTGFAVTALLLPTLGFLAKWLWSQTVAGWERRVSDLEKEVAQSINPKQLELLEKRFDAFGLALTDTQRIIQDLQKENLRLRGELTTDYVRREDWIRFSSTLEAKMDALNRKLDERMDILIRRERE